MKILCMEIRERFSGSGGPGYCLKYAGSNPALYAFFLEKT
jgi:hypothetical protein